jgi:SAM-dependent methyltransferase
MSETPVPYDDVAAFYAASAARFTEAAAGDLMRLVGAGPGSCLDVACGGGVHIPHLAAAGWRVTGVDVSTSQLAQARVHARDIAEELVHADASALPFAAEAFDVVVAAFLHTDVEDYAAVLRECRRVLRPEGRFVHVGTHPCFIGPFARRDRGSGTVTIHDGYWDRRRRFEGPGMSTDGLRARVGAYHLPAAELLNAVTAAGLRVDRTVEGPRTGIPEWFALGAVAE